MTKQQKTWLATIAGIVLLLCLIGVGWALSRREAPQVAKVRQLQATAFSRELDSEKRRELFDQMRSESEKLTDEQRSTLRAEMRETRTEQMRTRIDSYFAMNSEQRKAYLDEQIDEMEQRRKEWQKMAKQREARGEGDRGEARGQGDRRGPGRPRGAGGGRGRDANRTAEDRNDRRRGFLSHSSAEDRAKFMAYLEDMNERREARGMEPMGGRGGFGGGRRRR